MKENNEEVEGSEEIAKPSEYVKDLLKEKLTLNPEQHSNAMRLVDQEVSKAQAQSTGKPLKPESRYVDIYKEKPIKVVAKVLVPVKEHPRFNFVGKLLGPKGNSLKRLQEETMTKMAILGRGSMRDKTKEEELRTSLDPKYSHLTDDLHVEIQALAPPAEAYARIAFALAEIRKYLVPDVNDEIRQEQLREIQQYGGGGRGGGGPNIRGGVSRGGGGRGVPRPPIIPPRGAPVPPQGGPVPPRPMPGKTKVLSILDRARVAMEETYASGGYDDGYYESPGPMGYNPSGYGGAYNGSGFYDGGGYAGVLQNARIW
ncbi:KH domain-containing, RNA-binding, signal transduction-associated protein 3-like isoform X2 [Planococcus citri]|uniref:KH domain-containing, RNA-binding, signal transduction-associated protein 3-like isoform X2 n=1 Tax=Planococcus citri TaxID=170843 RepID=UPI0031F722F3